MINDCSSSLCILEGLHQTIFGTFFSVPDGVGADHAFHAEEFVEREVFAQALDVRETPPVGERGEHEGCA